MKAKLIYDTCYLCVSSSRVVEIQKPQCNSSIPCRCNHFVLQPCGIVLRKVPKGVCASADKISSLPDEILSHILDVLPVKDAVATSVLSNRWRLVFPWMTCLNFDISPISHCSLAPHMTPKFPTFINFVNSVLKSCKAPNINIFKLKLSNSRHIHDHHPNHTCSNACFPDLDSLCLTAWLSFPLTRLVRQFEVCANVRTPTCKLPPEIFCCTSLEKLVLESNLELQVPMTLSLPNVKVLHLSLHDLPDGNSLSRLVLSCPSLEDLVLRGYWKIGDDPLVISVPFLCRLVVEQLFSFGFSTSPSLQLKLPMPPYWQSMKMLHLSLPDLPDADSLSRFVSSCPSLEDLLLEGDLTILVPLFISSPSLRRLVIELSLHSDAFTKCVILDAPNLEYLSYSDLSASLSSVANDNMNSLVEAHLTMSFEDGYTPDTQLDLLRSVYNVSNLSLLYGFLEGLEVCESLNHKLPVFRNLRHLQLGILNVLEWRLVLLDLLDSSPYLETLAFPQGIGTIDTYMIDDCELECQYWSTIQRVPSCLSSNLQSIVIKAYLATEKELPMIKYLMQNALFLKELVIELDADAVGDRMSLDSTLQNIPRGSVTCSIKVTGL